MKSTVRTMWGHHILGRFSVRRSLRLLLASITVGLFLALVPVEVGLGNGELNADMPVAPGAIGTVHPRGMKVPLNLRNL